MSGKLFFGIFVSDRLNMKTAINIDITFDQVLSIVKNLPVRQKIKLSQALEEDGIKSRLDGILTAFKTDEISLDDINAEVEVVRQKRYENKKH